MSKVHPEAFVEWVTTGDVVLGTGGTVNGPAAQANTRNFVTLCSASFSAATATSVGTIVINFGATNTFKFQVPIATIGLYLNLTWTKAVRCDINFQPTVVLAGFTAGPTVSINLGGYKVRE